MHGRLVLEKTILEQEGSNPVPERDRHHFDGRAMADVRLVFRAEFSCYGSGATVPIGSKQKRPTFPAWVRCAQVSDLVCVS